ncbi:TolC family protein [Rhodanobacter glycinis]|uniref:TolC family protein n=1 Tax=Rhodanobacter glycinis TaxID=582702 RepID=UPI001127B2BE|nr:TolC family protein [Rhodanobacter glycinis]TPG50745.1 TolC family protein [Rhodanobacter glycinis]
MHRACYRSSLLVGCGVTIALWAHSTPAFANDAPVSWAQASTTTAAPAAADTPAVENRAYSLAELLKLALSINPQTREVEEQAYQADLATRLAKSQYAPQVSLKALGGIQRTPLAIPPTVSAKGYFVSSTREVFPTLEMKWLLFDFGRRKGEVEEARHNADAAQSAVLGTQEKLIYEVSEAYFDTVSAQGRIRAAQKALDAAGLAEQAVLDQRNHGRATVVQLAEAQRQTAAMHLALTKASGAADIAFAGLVATVGLPPESHFQVATPSDVATSASLRPLNVLIDDALESRPDILAAKDKVAASEAKVDTTRAAYRPTISLAAQMFQNIGEISSDGSPYSSINRTGNAVFVSFEWALFDGGARATNVSVALSEKSAAEDSLAATKNGASQQVVQAYNNLKTSLDNRAQSLAYTKASDVAYQATLDSYRRGLSSITDLMNNEAVLAQAQADQEDADADVQIAKAALDLALGRQPVSP